MRAVIQRVSQSKVKVENEIIGSIDKGIVILLGIGNEDTQADIDVLIEKIITLRIFEDINQKMNLSILDIKGQILVISQFTLYGDCKKGRRPSFHLALSPEKAKLFYEQFILKIFFKIN